MYYENKNHFFFACRKQIRNLNECFNFELPEQYYKAFCRDLFQLSVINEYEMENNSLRLPTDVFMYLIKQSVSHVDLLDKMQTMHAIYLEYIRFLSSDVNERDIFDFDLLYEYAFHKPEKLEDLNHPMWNKVTQRYDIVFEDYVVEPLLDLKRAHGVYMFLDKHERALYIGKSKNLQDRIMTSLKERMKQEEIYYYTYAVTTTESDAHIYEMYYIAKLKPKLNLQSKSEDHATMTLNDLEFVTPIPLKTRILTAFDEEAMVNLQHEEKAEANYLIREEKISGDIGV